MNPDPIFTWKRIRFIEVIWIYTWLQTTAAPEWASMAPLWVSMTPRWASAAFSLSCGSGSRPQISNPQHWFYVDMIPNYLYVPVRWAWHPDDPEDVSLCWCCEHEHHPGSSQVREHREHKCSQEALFRIFKKHCYGFSRSTVTDFQEARVPDFQAALVRIFKKHCSGSSKALFRIFKKQCSGFSDPVGFWGSGGFFCSLEVLPGV